MTVPTTVPQALAVRAHLAGERVAVVDGLGRRLTYSDWQLRARAAATHLVHSGVKTGDRIGLVIRDVDFLDYAVLYVAVQQAGACAVVVSARLTEREVADAMTAAGAQRCIRRLPGVEGADGSPEDRSRASALAQILFTSGSTGHPKPVAATHANLIKGIGRRLVTDPAALRRPETFVHALPIGTNAGQSMLLTCLSEADITVVLDGFEPARFCDAVATHRASGTLLVPAMAQALLQWKGPAAERLQSLRNLGLTGAPTPPSTLRRLAELCPSAEISNFYTTTEAWPAGIAMVYDPARPDALGQVARRDDVRLLRSDGADAGVGEVGGVQLRVEAAVSRAYLNELQSHNHGPDAFEWVATGDLGYVDGEGWLRLVDRADRMINSGGFKVPPRELEAVLGDHPDVADVAVFGIPHPVLGALIVAAVVPRTPQYSEADLLAFAGLRLASFKIPHRVLFVDALPVLVSGKVDIHALADLYERLRPSFAPPSTHAEEVVCEAWRVTLGLSRVGRLDDFFEVGGHSIAAAQVVAMVNQRLRCDLPISAVYRLRTPAAIAAQAGAERRLGTISPTAAKVRGLSSVPISRGQMRYARRRPDGALPNAIAFHHVRKRLEASRLQRALRKVCAAHPMLCTRFDLEAMRQVRAPAPLVDFVSRDLSQILDASDPALREILVSEALRAHDGDRCTGVLAAFNLGDGSTVLLWSLLHLAADGWSLGILTRQLAAAYNGVTVPPTAGADFFDVVVQESDYLESPAGRARTRELARTLSAPPRLPRFPGGTPDLVGPVATVSARLDLHDQTPEVRAAARAVGATPFMMLVAAYAAALSAWSEDAIALFSNVLGRDRIEVQDLVAPLNRSAVFRIEIPRAGSGVDLVCRVRDAITVVQAQPIPSPADVPDVDVAAYRRMALGTLPDGGEAPDFDGVAIESLPEGLGLADSVPPGGFPGLALAAGVSETRAGGFELTVVADPRLLPAPTRLVIAVGTAIRTLCHQPRTPLADLITALREEWG